MSGLIRNKWSAVAAGAFAVVCADVAAQGVYRQTDEKGRVIYSDVPQERPGKPAAAQQPQSNAAAVRPVPAQPQAPGGPAQYKPTGPVVDYTGRYSEPEPFGFRTSGKPSRPQTPERTLDQRIDEQNSRQATQEREAQQRAQAIREKALERDRMRVEREAKMRLEDDKRKLRDLSRENDRR